MQRMMKMTAITGLLAAALWVGAATNTTSAATATISAVGFQAPVFDSYDHSTGGGAWNDGSITFAKGELQGTNYRCGEITTYLAKLSVAASPTKTPAPYTAKLTVDFTTDSTGQSGVALFPLTTTDHLRINSGVIAAPGAGTGTGGSDGGFVPSTLTPAASVATIPAPTVTQNGTPYTSGAKERLVFYVAGLAAGTTTIVRMDARIGCEAGATPTGNLQAALTDVTVVSPAPDEAVSAGNQTVNFKNVANLGGLDSPVIVISKTVSVDGSTCPGVASRTLPDLGVVRYCYVATNYGVQPAYDLQLLDDYATPGNGSDDEIIDMVGMTDEDNDLFLDDLAGGGASISGTFDVVFTGGGIFTNTVVATASNVGFGAVGTTATVTVQAGLLFVKTVTTSDGTCPGSPTLTVPTANASETVKYCYSVTNFSGADVYDLYIDDTGVVAGTWTGLTDINSFGGADDLADGATATISWSPTLDTSTEASSQALLWWWEGVDQFNAASSATVTFEPLSPALTVTKAQTSADPVRLGDVITYSITAFNTGNVELTNVSLTDANATIGTCPTVATLAVGAAMTCAAAHTIVTDDLLPLSVDNVAVGHATGPSGALPNVNSNLVTTTITPVSELRVTITQTSSGAPKTGDTVTYEVLVTNAGNQPISTVQPSVTNATLGTCTPAAPAELLPGQTITCTATHVVTSAEAAAKVVTVKADAAGLDLQDQPITALQASSGTIPATGSDMHTVPWAAYITVLGLVAVAVAWRRREWIWVSADDDSE